MTEQQVDPFAAFRGQFPTKPMTARRIAGLLDAPGCDRRAVLDAAGVDLENLVGLLGLRSDRQSPYAITRGNQFETRVTSDHWSPVIALVREHLGFEIPEVRSIDLSAGEIRDQYRLRDQAAVQSRRAAMTRTAIEDMLTGQPDAFNLIRHPLTSLQIGGQTAWLEQDVLAFAHDGELFVVEIKSFPSIDGRPDPDKVSAALRQTAVYLLSVQELAAEIGFDPGAVSTKVLLVLPNNLSFNPVGKAVDVSMQLARLRRQIDAVPNVAAIVAELPDDIGLPTLPEPGAGHVVVAQARSAAREALGAVTARFGDACTGCPLFAECRSEAERRGLVSRLGDDLANTCGSVATVQQAIELADGRRTPHGEAERALADVLSRGIDAATMFGTAS